MSPGSTQPHADQSEVSSSDCSTSRLTVPCQQQQYATPAVPLPRTTKVQPKGDKRPLRSLSLCNGLEKSKTEPRTGNTRIPRKPQNVLAAKCNLRDPHKSVPRVPSALPCLASRRCPSTKKTKYSITMGASRTATVHASHLSGSASSRATAAP